MIEKLKEIIIENCDKRICVLGTSCCGKSTIINELSLGEDMDEVVFPLLSKEEEEYVCSDPWTLEIGEAMDNLVRTRVKIVPGKPLFGTVLLDCDLIIFLHIDDKLLKSRCESRGVNFMNAFNMQKKIEEEISKSNIESYVLECTDWKVDKDVKTI